MSTQPAPSVMQLLFPFVMMFAIFYLLVFRPQSKARKDHRRMLENLKKDDEVATTGGILGTVVNVKSDAVTLRIDEKVRIDVEKSAITRLVRSRNAEPTEQRA